MTPALWLPLAAVCALGAMSPGPSLAVVIRNAVGGGRAHGLAAAWAHAAGLGLYALLTVFGLAVVIEQVRLVYLTLSALGAAYLFYLGVRALRAGGAVQDAATSARHTGAIRAAREGFFIALSNPKVAVFLLAVFSQFLRPDMGRADHLLMASTATLIDALWYSLVAVLLTRPGWLVALQRRAVWVERITGVVLIALAAAGAGKLLLDGLRP